jgi:hypothetical protein
VSFFEPKCVRRIVQIRNEHLVVEKADTLFHKSDAKLLGSLEDRGIVLATSRGSNVLNTRAGSAEDVVDEGELQISRLALHKKNMKA